MTDHHSTRDPAHPAGLSRRRFLTGAGCGIGTAGVAAVSLTLDPAAAEAVELDRPEPGYRETEHVKRVYALARF